MIQSGSTLQKLEGEGVLKKRRSKALPPERMAGEAADPENQMRFWKKVNKEGPLPDPEKYPNLNDRCWEWTGSKTGSGYGLVAKASWVCVAHRFSYEMNIGHLPSAVWKVCHKCDNPTCVNPSHLFMGTMKDNTQDMIQKGRDVQCRGCAHHSSNFTEDDVIRIRGEYRDGLSTYRLSKMYKVHATSIKKLVEGDSWSHIGGFMKLRTLSESLKLRDMKRRKVLA